MRPFKTFAATVLAASFLTIPAFARPSGWTAEATHGHAKKSPAERARMRRARREAALKKAGVDQRRARLALATMERFEAERKPVLIEMRKHIKALRQLLRENKRGSAAFKREREALRAGRAKLRAIRKRERAALRKILTKPELRKLAEMRREFRARHHRGRRGHRR